MVNVILATAAAAFAPVDQHYLFQARQMHGLEAHAGTSGGEFKVAFESP